MHMLHKIIISYCNWLILRFLFLVIIISNNAHGQTVSTDSIQIADSLILDKTEFNFFMLDASYTNNKIKIGDQSDISVPAMFANISFFHKSGLYSDLMYTNYISADTLSYDTDIQLGFQKYFFNDIVDIDLNYTYHKFSGMDDFKGLDYNHTINISSGFNYKFLRIYADGVFYLDNENYFTDIGLSLLLDFENFIFKNDYIFIMPTLSVSYGTDYWLYDIYEPYVENILLPILEYRGYPVNNLSTQDVIERYLERNGLNTNTFTYQGIDFLIPITYGIGGVSATFAWMYNIPSDKVKEFGLRDQSGYIISLSYIF